MSGAPTHPSHSLFQLLPSGTRYQSIRACSARLLNSFFPQAVRALNSNHPAPLWNPIKIPPPPFFEQFKVCYTQVSGPVKTTCSNTLSSIRTTNFLTLLCVHKSHKRLSNICMFTCSCTTDHLTLFPSQLLECFSFCTCTVFAKHLYSLYFLVYV